MNVDIAEPKQQINRAARDIYKLFGFTPRDNETFHDSTDPVKIACWGAAVEVFYAAFNQRVEEHADEDSIPAEAYAQCLGQIYRH